jgi:hypothetical protein
MIHLIGGAPRVGKSVLYQQPAAKLRIGWMSTDSLPDLLRVRKEEGVKTEMNLERLDQFPGCSPGYVGLPNTLRRQIAPHIPIWSEFIRLEAKGFGYPHIDMVDDFPQRLAKAKSALIIGIQGIT